jgi:methyl-accepting chemotaxis protein
VIGHINDYVMTIAAAVEEQTATTNEMVRSVANAAGGSDQITTSIRGVADAAQSTTRGAADSRSATTDLSRMAAELHTLVGRFQC